MRNIGMKGYYGPTETSWEDHQRYLASRNKRQEELAKLNDPEARDILNTPSTYMPTNEEFMSSAEDLLGRRLTFQDVDCTYSKAVVKDTPVGLEYRQPKIIWTDVNTYDYILKLLWEDYRVLNTLILYPKDDPRRFDFPITHPAKKASHYFRKAEIIGYSFTEPTLMIVNYPPPIKVIFSLRNFTIWRSKTMMSYLSRT